MLAAKASLLLAVEYRRSDLNAERLPYIQGFLLAARGVVLTGGVALLRKIDECLRKETGLPVKIADDPLSTVVIGAGKLLSDHDLLMKVAVAVS